MWSRTQNHVLEQRKWLSAAELQKKDLQNLELLTLIFKTTQMWFWNVLTAKSFKRPGGNYSMHVTFWEILAFYTLVS